MLKVTGFTKLIIIFLYPSNILSLEYEQNPKQMIEDFLKINNPEHGRRTKMDYLVMGDYLVTKF